MEASTGPGPAARRPAYLRNVPARTRPRRLKMCIAHEYELKYELVRMNYEESSLKADDCAGTCTFDRVSMQRLCTSTHAHHLVDSRAVALFA